MRQNKINTILLSKRKIIDLEQNEKRNIEISNKKSDNFSIPTDFQFKIFKYYENVIFL